MAKKKISKKIKQVGTSVKNEVKKEVLLNVPNSLTLLRVILAFAFVYMLFTGWGKIALAIVFGVAAFTDWLDGYFARKLKQTTSIGARMDQVIDRVFTAIIVGALLIFYAKSSFYSRDVLFVFLVLSREIIGLPGFLIALIRNKDAYQVRYVGKVTTFIQGFALGSIILGIPILTPVLVIATCLIGIVSGIDYLRYSLS